MSCQVVLYHSNQCSHCIEFMPVWQNLITQVPRGVSCVDYEASRDRAMIPGTIVSFPTIHIIQNGVPIEYTGIRTVDSILEEIQRQAAMPVKTKLGGDGDKRSGDRDVNSDFYKQKYLKYKAKYLSLKN